MRSIFLALLFWISIAGATALPATAGDDEQIKAAQAIISAQIEAMRADDAPKAYSFAAPDVQLKFPSPDIFMGMVKSGYAPVYRPRSYAFAAGTVADGIITQMVDIAAADGSDWVAEYKLARMSDGSLKIIGCWLNKPAGESA